MMVDLTQLLVWPNNSIREVMACIERNMKGIALVVDENRCLIGTITDGDIRRTILAGLNLELPVQSLLEQRIPSPYPSPITAPVGTSKVELLDLMNRYDVRHIPLVDTDGSVVELIWLGDWLKEYELPLTAVVMAGGYGTRLRPLTEELPKPMLPIGERPLLELLIGQLHQAGIRRVNLTTHYKAEVIAQHFGDGQDFGVEIGYVKEEQPLGTAGALSLLDAEGPLLVINGDILTQVDFRTMLDFHQEHQADMTVAVREYEFRIPYGVVESDGPRVTGILEKPVQRSFINAGIYLLEPTVYGYIPNGQRFDMTDLIQCLLDEGRSVISFPIMEYWLDIGRHVDYEQAQEDIKNGRFRN